MKIRNSEVVYVRICDTYREVEFHSSWESAQKKRGKKKKFFAYQKKQMLWYILENWKGFTLAEVERWKAPEWIKEWKRLHTKNRVDVTIKEGIIYIKFEALAYPFKIVKSPLFYQIYDKHLYIYEKLLNIMEWVGYDKVQLYTDLVDLLRINRLYWKDLNIDLMVKVVDEKKLRIK